MQKREIQLVGSGIVDGVLVGKKPSAFDWKINNLSTQEPTVFYDSNILTGDSNNFSGLKTALIIESEGINQTLYSSAPFWIERFDRVYTHSSRLLETYREKCRFKPGGSFTIGSRWSPGEVGIHPKKKLCSILTSTKTMNPMHMFRLEIAKALKGSNVDVTISDKYGDYFIHLDEYMYSICIENYFDKYYFTERLLNCFVTGVVPIYAGATSLSSFFDTGGVLEFRTFNQLKSILDRIGTSDYESRKVSIENNFHTALLHYGTIEDWVISEYGETAFTI
jgi:hypothetical protein